jgi:hypothetical protein
MVGAPGHGANFVPVPTGGYHPSIGTQINEIHHDRATTTIIIHYTISIRHDFGCGNSFGNVFVSFEPSQ